jgi:hypothetical protein
MARMPKWETHYTLVRVDDEHVIDMGSVTGDRIFSLNDIPYEFIDWDRSVWVVRRGLGRTIKGLLRCHYELGKLGHGHAAGMIEAVIQLDDLGAHMFEEGTPTPFMGANWILRPISVRV